MIGEITVFTVIVVIGELTVVTVIRVIGGAYSIYCDRSSYALFFNHLALVNTKTFLPFR